MLRESRLRGSGRIWTGEGRPVLRALPIIILLAVFSWAVVLGVGCLLWAMIT